MAKKVLMAMSGGIDSTVAALLLLEQGYELTGVTFRTFDNISQGCLEKEKGCCNIDSLLEAKHMAQTLGFEHHIVDFRKEFEDTVIRDFIHEYLQGRTPNPCVVCNATIKWGKLMEIADQMGCEFIATGHYARVAESNGRYFLRKGADTQKDQSYFLWRLTQANLARTLFPLGEWTKAEVRQFALSRGYEKLSRKGESQEICFIPDNDYRAFLASHAPDYASKCQPGNFATADGKIVGKHRGYPNYTIGKSVTATKEALHHSIRKMKSYGSHSTTPSTPSPRDKALSSMKVTQSSAVASLTKSSNRKDRWKTHTSTS